jgi:uncharacterized protein YndB with AHSA1/START domain
MSNAATLSVTTPSDLEIAMSRVFDAPRRLVFEAHTKPALVKRWLLGPPGWTMPLCEIDLRVGGAYRYVWRHQDGREMAMGGVYHEIEAPARLVHTEYFDDPWYEGEALVTTTFVEVNGRTTLTTTMRFESRATRDSVLKSGMEKGVEISYDRLESILAEGEHR